MIDCAKMDKNFKEFIKLYEQGELTAVEILASACAIEEVDRLICKIVEHHKEPEPEPKGVFTGTFEAINISEKLKACIYGVDEAYNYIFSEDENEDDTQ